MRSYSSVNVTATSVIQAIKSYTKDSRESNVSFIYLLCVELYLLLCTREATNMA